MTKKIPSIRVELSEDQIKTIRPIMDKAMQADDENRPGFICAQIFEYQMSVFFIPQDKALKFQELMDQKIGLTTVGTIVMPEPTEVDVRHRCSTCLRDFSSLRSAIVHIGKYHSRCGSGEYDPKAHAIPKV